MRGAFTESELKICPRLRQIFLTLAEITIIDEVSRSISTENQIRKAYRVIYKFTAISQVQIG